MAPATRWVGNDPALLYLHFKLRMETHQAKADRKQGGNGGGGGGGEDSSRGGGASATLESQLMGNLKAGPKGESGGGGSFAVPLNDYDAQDRENGWVHAKQAYVEAQNKQTWLPPKATANHDPFGDGGGTIGCCGGGGGGGGGAGAGNASSSFSSSGGGGLDVGGAWRLERELRPVPRNVYGDIEALTLACRGVEQALVALCLTLVEGGAVHGEVTENLAQNWHAPTMFGNAVNWLGIAKEHAARRRSPSALSVENKERNFGAGCGPRSGLLSAEALSLQYHILLEAMSDTGALGPTAKSDWRELCAMRGLDLMASSPSPAASSGGGGGGGGGRVPRIGRVEVLGKRGEVAVLYFPVPAIVRACWGRPAVQKKKHAILYPESLEGRQNPEEKVKNFLEACEELADVLKHEFMLLELSRGGGTGGGSGGWGGWFGSGSGWALAFLGRRSALLGLAALFLSVALNAALLATLQYKTDQDHITAGVWGHTSIFEDDGGDDGGGGGKNGGGWGAARGGLGRVVVFALSVLHVVVSWLLFASYAISTGWRSIRVGFEDNEDGIFPIYDKQKALAARILCPYLLVRPSKHSSSSGGLHVSLDGESVGGGGGVRATLQLPSLLRGPYFFFAGDAQGATYFLAFAALSALGLVYSPLFFTASMLDVVRMNSTMQKVAMSFTKNFDQVAVTVALLAILLYLFAAWGFGQNYQYAFEDHTPCLDGGEETCGGRFYNWLLLHFDYGVINPLIFTGADAPMHSASASLFQFLYFFIINLVITAIVSGIIIDTFAEIRGARGEVEEDLVSSCFICDISVEDFETHGVSFNQHTKHDHNMWQYLWLKLHLQEKDRTQYSGTEAHVAPHLRRNNPAGCLPLKQSRAIHGSNLKEKATLPVLLRKLGGIAAAEQTVLAALHELRKKVDASHDELSERIHALAHAQAGDPRSLGGHRQSSADSEHGGETAAL